MDIWLQQQGESSQIHPLSVHGMLWLQTHFEDRYWAALAENRVSLPIEDVEILSKDAQEAGLTMTYLSKVNTTNLSGSQKLL